MERTISMMVGKGSLNHNNRAFTAKNVDRERSQFNRIFVKKNIKKVYHELFDEALDSYNTRQTRADRKIDNYYEKIRTGKQEKLFHEIIVQIGNKDDTNCSMLESLDAQFALEEYMETFQERNPNLRVFNAVLHLDEETPHLHIDFIPFSTGNKRGLSTKVSLKGALKAQGFVGTGRNDTEWKRWVDNEKQQLAEIMKKHELEWKQKGTHEKHLSVYDFEKKMRKAEVEELEQEISEKERFIAGQNSRVEENDAVLQIQEQSIWDNEERAKEKQRKADEALEIAERKKEDALNSYETWNIIKENAQKRYQKYIDMCDEKQKEYESLTDKKKELEENLSVIQNKITDSTAEKEQVQDEVERAQLQLDIVNAQLEQAIKGVDEAQQQTQGILSHAEELYSKYSKVAVTDRQYQMFEDMVQLGQENDKLKEENRTLREKLQKAYNFMKQFTINGRNMFEHFLESVGERVQQFTQNFGGRR